MVTYCSSIVELIHITNCRMMPSAYSYCEQDNIEAQLVKPNIKTSLKLDRVFFKVDSISVLMYEQGDLAHFRVCDPLAHYRPRLRPCLCINNHSQVAHTPVLMHQTSLYPNEKKSFTYTLFCYSLCRSISSLFSFENGSKMVTLPTWAAGAFESFDPNRAGLCSTYGSILNLVYIVCRLVLTKGDGMRGITRLTSKVQSTVH